ncbi:MAG: YCF48-related protein [bacterium]
MKRIINMLFVIILFAGIVNADGWRTAHKYMGESLTKVFMINNMLGWSVGASGQILKTTDGGQNWENFKAPVIASLYGVYFVDEQHGFIGTTSQTLLTTVDGGENWNVVNISSANGTIKEIYFPDLNNGFLMVSNTAGGQIIKTTDGGNTWNISLQATRDLLAMSFSSPTKGIVTGKDVGTLYYTTDGSTWTNSPIPDLGGFNYSRSDIWGLYMVNDNVAYASGWGSRAAGLQPSIHLKTTNGGATWEYQTLSEEQRTYVNLEEVYFKDELNGFCVGGTSSYEGSVIIKTTDGGINWEYLSLPFGFPVSFITGIGDQLWVTGDGGCIGYSSDFGQTWVQITKVPASNLNSIQVVTDKIIFSVGFGGVYVKSTDGGFSWNGGYVVVNNKCPKINAVCFVNDQIGYIARSSNQVCKTTDGGNTWFAVIKDSAVTSLVFNGIHFIDENLGYVVGRVGNNMLKTTDGGTTWTTITTGGGVDLYDVYFTDANNGVIIGKNRTVMYTIDGGLTWVASTLNGIPASAPSSGVLLNDVEFYGANIGYIAGVLSFKTTDGGKTWDYFDTPDPTKTMTHVSGFSADKWFMAGQKSIFESTDGGANWASVCDTNVIDVATLYGTAYDKSGYTWVTGGYSSIFTTAPFVSMDDENINVNSFTLNQNYPNPFNPSTIIKYSINEPGLVNLSVFNLLGQKISTLVNKEQSTGAYSLNFDASKLSSGVYFYSLKVNNNIITKKMMLLR